MKNWFEELNNVDVSAKLKQKNGLNYIAWMDAWTELKKRYPLSFSTVHESPEGMLVWKDPVGCHVKTSVTIVWDDNGERCEHTVTEYLPCMDFKNKPIPYESADAMAINKAIQRSMTKCIARLGLGAFVFAGDDLPEEVSKAIDLQNEVIELVKKKCALSDKTKEKVVEICKAIEREANPAFEDAEITGNPKNVNDSELLEKLKRQLLAVRKI